MKIPSRNVFVNADSTSAGLVFLNSTWGFVSGATVFISGDGLSSLECTITDVRPDCLQIRSNATPGYGGTDLSAYTLAKNTRISQPVQTMPEQGFESQIDPNNQVTLADLNAPLVWIGTITSSGTSANNGTTATAFYNTNQALKEMVITVQCDQAAYIAVGTTNAIAATTNCEQLQAGEKRTIALSSNQGWIAVYGVGGAIVNMQVFRHQLA